MGTWKIIFEGNLFDGQKPEIVKERLASLFNSDPAKVERLFQGSKVIIKSGIDYFVRCKKMLKTIETTKPTQMPPTNTTKNLRIP